MKKIIPLLLTTAMLLCCSLSASAIALSDEPSPTNEVEFETVIFGGKAMTVPVFTQEESYKTSVANGNLVKNQKVTCYIPVTAEGQAYNENYVQSVMSARSSGTETDSYPDPHNYFLITTYIRYTMYPSEDGSVSDYLVSIDNVAITKESEPPDVEWDILGIGTPKVRVVNTGATEHGNVSAALGQILDYTTIHWGEAGLDTPSDWVPVISGDYSDMYRGLATFRFDITYSTMGKVPCEFEHVLAK